MSGLYVRCGSFEGGDKSASALHIVLDSLVDAPSAVLDAIRPVFDDCYVSVPEAMAAQLLPHLRAGRAALVARLGHDDVARADREDRGDGEAGPREGSGWKILYFDRVIRAGRTRIHESRGWELWCYDEVITACEVSAAEHQPLVFHYF